MPSSHDALLLSAPVPVPARRFVLPRIRLRHGAAGDAIGSVVLALVVLLAVVGPLLSRDSPTAPSGAEFLPPGSLGHLLGTDELGQDILARVLVGLRTSLFASVVVTGLSAVAGLVIGTVAGFLGGWIDSVLMRLTDLFLAFPATIVAMAIAAGLGPSLTSSMIGIGVVWWPLYARVVRGEVRRVMASPHVQGAWMSGTRGIRLAVKHVIPSVLPTVAVTASLDIGGVIMTLASLAFVGLGTPAPAPELGLMSSAGLDYILNAWWIAIIPAVAVGVLSLLFNYFGDGLRKVLRARGV